MTTCFQRNDALEPMVLRFAADISNGESICHVVGFSLEHWLHPAASTPHNRFPPMGSRRHRPRTPPPLVQAKRIVIGGIKTVAESPWMKFTTGVVLLTSGLDEAVETLFADLSALELGAHHGVMVLGFVNVLSSLPDMLDGLVGTFLVDEHDDADGTDTPTAASTADQATTRTANAPTADTEQLRRAA